MNRFLSRMAVASTMIAFVVLSSSFSAQAADKKKISGVNKFGPTTAQTTSYPGDIPNHEIVQFTRIDSVTSSNSEFNGATYVVYEQDDQVAGTGSHRGYGRQINKSGEEIFDKWEGTHKTIVKDGGAWEATFEGKFQFVSGTGKFKNIKGGGTYKGSANADGGASHWEGEIEY